MYVTMIVVMFLFNRKDIAYVHWFSILARDTADASETTSGGEVDAMDADTFGDEDTMLSSFAPDTATIRS